MLAGDDFSDWLQQRGVQLMRNAEIKQLALPARSREIAFVLQHGQIKPTTKRSDLLGNVVAAEGKRPPGEALAREHKQRGLLVVGKIKEERLVFVQQLLQLLGCERMRICKSSVLGKFVCETSRQSGDFGFGSRQLGSHIVDPGTVTLRLRGDKR